MTLSIVPTLSAQSRYVPPVLKVLLVIIASYSALAVSASASISKVALSSHLPSQIRRAGTSVHASTETNAGSRLRNVVIGQPISRYHLAFSAIPSPKSKTEITATGFILPITVYLSPSSGSYHRFPYRCCLNFIGWTC